MCCKNYWPPIQSPDTGSFSDHLSVQHDTVGCGQHDHGHWERSPIGASITRKGHIVNWISRVTRKNGEYMEENMRMVQTGAAALFSLSALLLVGASEAGEITVMSTVAVKEAYLELVPAFECATENKVMTMWVGTGSIIARVKRGEIVDLVIVTESGIDGLNKLGRLAAGVPMAKSGVGAAMPAGAPRPDISSGEVLKRALLASSIALSPGPSGVYLSSLGGC